jgi:hypothetical protein
LCRQVGARGPAVVAWAGGGQQVEKREGRVVVPGDGVLQAGRYQLQDGSPPARLARCGGRPMRCWAGRWR